MFSSKVKFKSCIIQTILTQCPFVQQLFKVMMVLNQGTYNQALKFQPLQQLHGHMNKIPIKEMWCGGLLNQRKRINHILYIQLLLPFYGWHFFPKCGPPSLNLSVLLNLFAFLNCCFPQNVHFILDYFGFPHNSSHKVFF